MRQGLSGRALRKLPFQAHAVFVQVRPLPAARVDHHVLTCAWLCGAGGLHVVGRLFACAHERHCPRAAASTRPDARVI